MNRCWNGECSWEWDHKVHFYFNAWNANGYWSVLVGLSSF